MREKVVAAAWKEKVSSVLKEVKEASHVSNSAGAWMNPVRIVSSETIRS